MQTVKTETLISILLTAKPAISLSRVLDITTSRKSELRHYLFEYSTKSIKSALCKYSGFFDIVDQNYVRKTSLENIETLWKATILPDSPQDPDWQNLYNVLRKEALMDEKGEQNGLDSCNI